MAREALLNAPLEAAVCRRMISTCENRLHDLENTLTRQVFDRELYREHMGRIFEARSLLNTLTSIYAKEFEV